MLRKLRLKCILVNMLVVTVSLLVMFGYLVYETGMKMDENGGRILQSIHEGRHEHGPGQGKVPYFLVHVDRAGNFTLLERDYFSRTSDEELLQIARKAYSYDRPYGFVFSAGVRFSRMTDQSGTQLAFLDDSVERNMLMDLMIDCISISVVSYAVFLLISIVLSRWAIRPVALAWDQQRQFVADASHELKTPLTVISTNAELLEDASGEDGARYAANIRIKTRQMRDLVEGLLDLSRVDDGVSQSLFRDVHFSDLLEESLLEFEPLFFENGLRLEQDIASGILVSGSELLLRQAAEILLDNAVKYASPEKPVQVSMRHSGCHVTLKVATAGDSISREDLKRIFKRFYRIDKARSESGSYGLGLPIAEAIVREHKGRIWAESREGINTFCIQLPLRRKLRITR